MMCLVGILFAQDEHAAAMFIGDAVPRAFLLQVGDDGDSD